MKKVYLIENIIGEEVQYKIGWTGQNMEDRIKGMTTGNPGEWKVILEYNTKFATKIEAYLKRNYSNKQIKGEFFKLNQNDLEEFGLICRKVEKNITELTKYNNHFIKI